MPIRRAMVGAIALLALAASARGEERLVLEPYPGQPWQDVVNQANGVHFFHEQMPQGQTPDNFQDLLTSQSLTTFTGTPSEFLTGAFAQLSQNCETVETVGPTAAEEQGRRVAYGRLYCGKQKGQAFGAHMFFKVIKGSDALYVIDRDFRMPPTDHPSTPTLPEDQAITLLQAEGAARKYLNEQVYVCDPVFPDPKCRTEAVPTGR